MLGFHRTAQASRAKLPAALPFAYQTLAAKAGDAVLDGTMHYTVMQSL